VADTIHSLIHIQKGIKLILVGREASIALQEQVETTSLQDSHISVGVGYSSRDRAPTSLSAHGPKGETPISRLELQWILVDVQIRYVMDFTGKKIPGLTGYFSNSDISEDKLIVFANLFHGQPDTTLLVYFKNLDLDHLTFFNHVGHILNTLIGKLRNVYKAIAAWCQ
jgi:hypothetical protein